MTNINYIDENRIFLIEKTEIYFNNLQNKEDDLRKRKLYDEIMYIISIAAENEFKKNNKKEFNEEFNALHINEFLKKNNLNIDSIIFIIDIIIKKMKEKNSEYIDIIRKKQYNSFIYLIKELSYIDQDIIQYLEINEKNNNFNIFDIISIYFKENQSKSENKVEKNILDNKKIIDSIKTPTIDYYEIIISFIKNEIYNNNHNIINFLRPLNDNNIDIKPIFNIFIETIKKNSNNIEKIKEELLLFCNLISNPESYFKNDLSIITKITQEIKKTNNENKIIKEDSRKNYLSQEREKEDCNNESEKINLIKNKQDLFEMLLFIYENFLKIYSNSNKYKFTSKEEIKKYCINYSKNLDGQNFCFYYDKQSDKKSLCILDTKSIIIEAVYNILLSKLEAEKKDTQINTKRQQSNVSSGYGSYNESDFVLDKTLNCESRENEVFLQ